MEKNRKLERLGGGLRGEFRYENIRKLKDKEGARDQQEEGRTRDEGICDIISRRGSDQHH